MVDVNYFKLYNEGYGHSDGDKCLQEVDAAPDEALAPRRCTSVFGAPCVTRNLMPHGVISFMFREIGYSQA